MSETPDLSTLPARMRYAATVVTEVNERLVRSCNSTWGAFGLREIARRFEAEDDERGQLVEQLAHDIHNIDNPTAPWGGRSESIRGTYREYARQIIVAGWTKAADK